MEPIRVNRHTGQIISAPTYTPEQMDILLTAIAKALVQKRPDLFRVDTPAEAAKNEAQAAGGAQ